MVREQESERVNVSDSGGGEKSETGGELHPSRYADSSISRSPPPLCIVVRFPRPGLSSQPRNTRKRKTQTRTLSHSEIATPSSSILVNRAQRFPHGNVQNGFAEILKNFARYTDLKIILFRSSKCKTFKLLEC